MPPGRAGYLHPNLTGDTNSNRPLSGLFDDGSLWTQMASGSWPEIDPGTPSTWIPIVMHLADNSQRAATFDAAQWSYASRSAYYAYKTISFDGSIDGIHRD